MSSNTDDLGNPKVDLPDGSALFALPHDPDLAAESLQKDLGSHLGQKAGGSTVVETPDPTSDDDATIDPRDDGGPLRRFTDVKSPLGMVGLESLAKDEDEIAKAISARSDEIYRNEFPVIVPKYDAKCDDCGAEFDDKDTEECRECGATDLTTPDASDRRTIEGIFEQVNKEGQSMRQLGKITDEDHSRLGTLCWVIRWNYITGPGGEIIKKNFSELLRGDPKRIVPVVDDDGRVGGVWYTCPVHRQEAVTDARDYDDGVTECPHCGASLHEVHYVELDGAGRKDLEKYYFQHEIVMYAGHVPQAHGLDGLSPVHLVWLEQAILHWMDVYAAEYFNPHSERTPNKFLIVHTANPDSFEAQLDEAKDEAAANPYKSGIFYNQLNPDQNANTEAQVIDVMGDEFLGQSEEIRKRFENHIRTVFGVSDVFDSELEDAGGLNNEGLQLEVTDRSTAAAQQDYSDGPYDELLRYLGFEEWRVQFVPPRETDLEEQAQALDVLRRAAELGLPARMENGEPVVGDGEAEAPAQPMGEDGDGIGDIPPPDEDGDEGNPQADDPREALRELTEAQKHVVWADDPDVAQKARDPFWDRDEAMPEFVEETIREALRGGAVQEISDDLPADVTRRDVGQFFEDQLSQPQGWSLRSLTDNYAEQFGVDPDEAVTAVRTQTTSILNDARAEGYQDQGIDEQVFKWVGPDDNDNTEACLFLKGETNPDHGGTPKTLDELEALVQRANDEFFPDFTGSDYVPHWNCRHTFVEHFD